VLPLRGPQRDQTLLRIERRADGGLDTSDLGPVQFVPLV